MQFTNLIHDKGVNLKHVHHHESQWKQTCKGDLYLGIKLGMIEDRLRWLCY